MELYPVCICGEKGTKRCGNCLTVRYCGAKCQSQDWKNHKKVCWIKQDEFKNSKKDGAKLVSGVDTNKCVDMYLEWLSKHKNNERMAIMTVCEIVEGHYLYKLMDTKENPAFFATFKEHSQEYNLVMSRPKADNICIYISKLDGYHGIIEIYPERTVMKHE